MGNGVGEKSVEERYEELEKYFIEMELVPCPARNTNLGTNSKNSICDFAFQVDCAIECTAYQQDTVDLKYMD